MQKKKLYNQLSILVALLLLCSTLFVSPALAVDPPPGSSTEGAQEDPGARSADPQSAYALGVTQSGTLLEDRFGVTLALQANTGGANGYSFDWDSFQPTKNVNTVDWIESDWYGMWEADTFGNTSTVRGIFPSGGEWYDVEALYFDNDVQNFYIAIVTSVPHYKDYGGGIAGVGIYDTRVSGGYWVRPGDLSIDLGLDTARQERYDTWHYNYGLDITHDNRNHIESSTLGMHDDNVGTALYQTHSDAGGPSDIELPPDSDWYTSGPSHNAAAGWELTNFDPIFSGLSPLGSLTMTPTVSYYQYHFYDGSNEVDENGAGTYVIEATIPRELFGDENPGNGEEIGLRWVEGCRNDGNSTSAVVKLTGTVNDIETGDAPDSTNHFGENMTYSGDGDPDAPDAHLGYFPTVADTGATGGGAPYGMCHLVLDGGARLGDEVSAERDADLAPDQDIIPNLNPTDPDFKNDLDGADDGLDLPGTWQDGEWTSFDYTVKVPANGSAGDRYVNVWFDWNRDGRWDDSGSDQVECRTNGYSADEHVVKNEKFTNMLPGQEELVTVNFRPCNPNPYDDDDSIWVRITLSDEPVASSNVRDEFNAVSFSNNDGTDNWGNSWQEVDESGTAGPDGGEVRVSNGRLCIGPNDSSGSPDPGPGAWRRVDLSGATFAILSFDYEATTNNTDDHFDIQVSTDGGTNWTTIHTFEGSSSGSWSYDLANYISADTAIRLRTSQYYDGSSDIFCADNIQVAYSTGVEDGRGPGYCYADGETEDWYLTPHAATGVDIASFDALVEGQAVLLTWETANELDLLGFDIERAESADGPWTQLTESLIPSEAPGSPIGATYNFLDTSVTGGLTYHYRLVLRDASGGFSYHGPISVVMSDIGEPLPPTPAGVYRVFLPLVNR